MEDTYKEIINRLDRMEEMMTRSFEMLDRRLSGIEEGEREDIPAMAEEVRTALSRFREQVETDMRYVYDKAEREWNNLDTTVERIDRLVERINDKVNG